MGRQSLPLKGLAWP